MAEAIESMSTNELRAEVSKGRLGKAYASAKAKAGKMNLIEKGTAIGLATGVGALETYKPELAEGFMGAGYANPILAGVGLLGLIMLKGSLMEVASGAFMAGTIPLAAKVGSKIAEAAAG